MTTFGDQIRDALQAIPHAADCGTQDYQAELQRPCGCDREARIAERVALAIEAAIESHVQSVDGERSLTRRGKALMRIDEAAWALGVLRGGECTR